jgi:hypothetical protein
MNVKIIGTEFGSTKFSIKAKKSAWKGGLELRVTNSIKQFSGTAVVPIFIQGRKRRNRPKTKRKRQDYKGIIRQFYNVPSRLAPAALKALRALE